MACVVFLRAANVGGHQVFKPADVAKALGVVNIGAAGTFVVRDDRSPDAVRDAFLGALDFTPELAVVPGEVVSGWLLERSFGEPVDASARRFVSVLMRPASAVPALPSGLPDPDWEVQLVAVNAHAAFTWQRGPVPHKLYPNAAVEKLLGVPATTRGWSTLETITKRLAGA